MAANPPQVLARRTNGTTAPASEQGGQSGKKRSEGRSGRRRGRGARNNDAGQKGDGTPKAPKPRQQIEGVKVVIRRLPPGMTQEEFVNILGEEWAAGRGRVDWLSYGVGKVSSDPSKPSRPARAYIHLQKREDLMLLDENVRAATWEDAKATFTNPSLVGPPSLEFAVYKKVPLNPRKPDSRSGTIDQDPEFMAFLEELANPAPQLKDLNEMDTGDDSGKAKAEESATTTPLIEFLKEKKANKNKDRKRGDKGKGGKDDDSKKKGKEAKSSKGDKATKESVKILKQKAAASSATEKAAEAAQKAAAEITAGNGQDAPKSRRANIAAAARVLQRDHGLSPGTAHRRARQDAAKAEASAKPADTKDIANTGAKDTTTASQTEGSTSQSPKGNVNASTAGKAQAGGRKGRGGKDKEKTKAADTQPTVTKRPTILKKGAQTDIPPPTTTTMTTETVAPSPAPASNANKAAPNNEKGGKAGKGAQKKAPAVSADGTKAFVKHVNSSQGVTEATLKETLGAFGAIISVEVDKRKAFAYVEFADHDGLVKAINASPVTVAQGSVQVVERKDKKPAAEKANSPAASGAANAGEKEKSNRGRRGRGGKANAANGQAASTATPAAAAPPAGESG